MLFPRKMDKSLHDLVLKYKGIKIGRGASRGSQFCGRVSRFCVQCGRNFGVVFIEIVQIFVHPQYGSVYSVFLVLRLISMFFRLVPQFRSSFLLCCYHSVHRLDFVLLSIQCCSYLAASLSLSLSLFLAAATDVMFAIMFRGIGSSAASTYLFVTATVYHERRHGHSQIPYVQFRIVGQLLHKVRPPVQPSAEVCETLDPSI